MIFQRAYCTNRIFDSLSTNKDEKEEYDIMFKILKDHSDVILDVDKEEFDKLILEDGPYKSMIRRDVGEFGYEPSTFKYFHEFENEEIVDNHNHDILLLDDDMIDASAKRKETGCMAFNLSDLGMLQGFDTVQGFTFKKCREDEKNHYQNWIELLDDSIDFPTNSLMIFDNYMYKNEEEFNSFKKDNLYSIIAGLIPEDIEVDFHILIGIDNRGAVLNKDKANSIIEDLYEDMDLDEDKIKIGLMTYAMNDDIHERVVITNNTYFRSDKGFNVIKNSDAVKPTYGDIRWCYNSILNYRGESLKKRQVDYLKTIRKQMHSNLDSVDSTKFNAGFVDNRLFNF